MRFLPGAPMTGMWFNPNSRGSRLRIWQPWGCKSLHAHHFTESKPQQTGTRLLPGHGEVATTSGSSLRLSLLSEGRRLPRCSTKCEGGLLRVKDYGSASQSIAGWSNRNSSLFESEVGGANPSPVASLRSLSFGSASHPQYAQLCTDEFSLRVHFGECCGLKAFLRRPY